MGKRADLYLVENGFAESRAEAQAAIAAGLVCADGKLVCKSSQTIAEGAAVAYEKAHPYVSRGALKLIAALDGFGLSPSGRVCLDLGASTGGFTQVLLERGAGKVYAVDVGHGQLHKKLQGQPRLVSFEGLNGRDLNDTHIRERIEAVVADVSFIPLALALAPALALAAKGAWLVALVKPQFEAGPEHVGKGGIVKDEAVRAATLQAVADWLAGIGWSVQGTMASPIAGGDGNREYLLAATKP